ncbi:MAG TPA: hypothetical protein VH309_05105 [Elusimicrobiota bacterium]|nr:hypothetical protein [Elusimicrobiota bacterium]
MDFKDILLQNENSLPTIQDTMGSPSTTTAMTANTGTLPTVTASATTWWKFGVSSVVGLLGMYYLAAGKKQSDFGKMLLGAGLTLASFFLF